MADEAPLLPSRAPSTHRRFLVRDLLADFPVDAVVDQALPEIRDSMPPFRRLDRETTRAELTRVLSAAVGAVGAAEAEGGRESGGWDARTLAALGARRADQGVPLEAVLMAFRVTSRLAVDALLDAARARGLDPESALTLTRSVWAYCDAAAEALVAGHRAHDGRHDDVLPSRQGVLLRRLVNGELLTHDVRRACAALGLHPDRRYHVVVLTPRAGDEPPEALARERLHSHYSELAAARVVGLVPEVRREPWPGMYVGFGDAVAAADLRSSLAGAEEAADLAAAFHLDRPQHADDVQLLRPVRDLPELGDRFVDRCFGHIDGTRATTMVATLRAWFDAHGNTEAAAASLFVHKNTLRYRIRGFREWTGLNLDRPEDCFVVWWALRRLDARGGFEQDPGTPDPA